MTRKQICQRCFEETLPRLKKHSTPNLFVATDGWRARIDGRTCPFHDRDYHGQFPMPLYFVIEHGNATPSWSGCQYRVELLLAEEQP